MKPSTIEIIFAGHRLLLDASGVAYWPEERLLIVSDLHFEKGSFLAQFGSALPLHDTRDTLLRLKAAIDAHQPHTVICLGDSFHDAKAGVRLEAGNRALLLSMIESVARWCWILGNHDKEHPQDMPGASHIDVIVQGVRLVHAPVDEPGAQIFGHYHPKTTVRVRGQSIRGKAFVHDARFLLMPSFGSYTGGLDVEHPEVASHFEAPRYHLLYRSKIWPV